MSTQTPSRQPMSQQDIQSAPTREMGTQNISNQQIQQTLSEMQRRMDEPVRQRPGNETKPAFLSTEFYIYLAAVGFTLLAADLVGRDASGVDPFRANQAWFFITLMTIAYLGSRGLSKLGNSWRHGRR
ncbi:hypothetical protein [Plantactinospora soyae]|uniref:Uncharacterized protein n=1 Tax=Plantactinospora soyae TaxID=1544732 RepID=A0A927M7R5_9ACTN|nr:hypothetical protein [Plantactinospora soyae]MBE1488607.1 hypothetical protein [Plantactinospora soyae]